MNLRDLSIDLVGVTEGAALAASQFIGRDDKLGADLAAVDAMRDVLSKIPMRGRVIIGEGEKDEAPMLYCGEELGTGEGPEFDIAVDPIDGTTACAKGREGSIATLAIGPKGSMYDPGPFVYMNKIAVGPSCVGAIDINKSITENLDAIADRLQKDPTELTVVMLDRPRHEEMIREIREYGARMRLIQDGDVVGAILTAWIGSGVDVLFGIGGTPEGVLAACALRALGGEIQGKPYPRNETERQRGIDEGFDPERVLRLDDIDSYDEVYFVATGITDGPLVNGVLIENAIGQTDSIVIRGVTGTVRQIISTHQLV